MPHGDFEAGPSEGAEAINALGQDEFPAIDDLLNNEETLNEFVRGCEFDFEIAALLLCEAPRERYPIETELLNFDFEAILDDISLEPEPVNPHALLAKQQALVFGPLRPVVEICANHPYLQWLTADLHLPESVNRWLRSPHAMMAC